MSKMDVISVSDINTIVKEALETNISGELKIIGELSNVKPSRTHLYASLKDESSSINIMMWNYETKIKKGQIEIDSGDNVIVTGKINLYSKTGSYNIMAIKIEKFGEDVDTKYEETKKICETKGYFNQERKKRMPFLIDNIGIITSESGAAIADIMFVFKKNNLNGNIYIKDTIVQGSNSPKSIVESIKYFNNFVCNNGKKVDILLISRGGGYMALKSL